MPKTTQTEQRYQRKGKIRESKGKERKTGIKEDKVNRRTRRNNQ